MKPSRAPSSPVWSSRASVLVIVLVTVLFASMALVAFVEKAGDDLIVESRAAISRRLRREAYSALEVTFAVLEQFRQVNGGLRSAAEGWGDPLVFAGWMPRNGCEASVQFEDESGKLSLPHAELAPTVTLFRSWGISQSDAERLADALFSWMKKDFVPGAARAPDYENTALPYTPPLRPMRSYSELAAIDYAREIFYDEQGQPNELWHRFVSTFSLFDFKQTNLNGASVEAMEGMGLLDRSQQQQLGDYLAGKGSRQRQGPGFFQTMSDANNLLGNGALPSNYGTEISALRINITIREGRTAFRLSAVVAPSGGAKAIQEVAASHTITDPNQKTPTPDPTAASSAASPGTAATAKKLNYPFTLLEIVENAEISAVPASPPQA